MGPACRGLAHIVPLRNLPHDTHTHRRLHLLTIQQYSV